MWGSDIGLELCVGFGVLACAMTVESSLQGGINLGGGADFLLNLIDSKNGAEYTTTWSYSTSRDVWLAGKQSDTFLVPNLNMNFHDGKKIDVSITYSTYFIMLI